jgi:predicted solute-binding protein
MANSLNSMPIVIDTDLVSFGAAQTLQHTPFGIRVTKLVLSATGTTSAGTVSITRPGDNLELYPTIGVAAAATTGTTVLSDNPEVALTWRDFSVTGITGTGTQLLIWYRV